MSDTERDTASATAPDGAQPRPVTSEPAVDTSAAYELAPDAMLIPDGGVELVPNIGIVGGSSAVLVVDTGLGPGAGERVLEFARTYADGRQLYLTTTHFHPEHAFGAQAFDGAATYLVNRAQADDLAERGADYLAMFRGLGEPVARALEHVRFVAPGLVYDDAYDLDLGGRVVRLRATGRGHTRGDQVVEVPDEVGETGTVVFTGDLAESGQFAILPWFPPHDVDVSGLRWIAVLEGLLDEQPRLVVPGHGEPGGPDVLAAVRDYLRLLRDETWGALAAGLSEKEVGQRLVATLPERYPDWAGLEWIQPGVGCLCSEWSGQSTAV